jgi:5-methyltetrahydrofolate--homocysteine methyltransferase
MERQGFEIPLLIGGATTSRAHTAVKVDGQYHGPVVWVKDASRSVPIASQLLNPEQRETLMSTIKSDYDSLRARHAAKATERPLISLDDARANATPIDWSAGVPAAPHAGITGFLDYPSRTCATTSTGRPSRPGRSGALPDVLNTPGVGWGRASCSTMRR